VNVQDIATQTFMNCNKERISHEGS